MHSKVLNREIGDNEIYRPMLEDDANLRRWYFNNTKGSQIVADVYLRRLGFFCLQHKFKPADYARLPKRKMEEVAFDYIQEMEQKINPRSGKKYAPSYIASNLKAILSWARWNRKAFEIEIKIADSGKRPTLVNERVPTNDELRKVLYAPTTKLRTRVAIAIMAFAGCRPEVQGNYTGLDGLRIKDLPELEIQEKKVEFTKMPTRVIVREELSKIKHWYPTFLCEEGCEFVKQYMDYRIAQGEKLTPETGITVSIGKDLKISGRLHRPDLSPFMRTTKIGEDIRIAMRASGLPWRPYVFRSYFDTAMMLGESRGMVTHAFQQCWMGHNNSIEDTYTLRKGQLPAELLEDMRSSYVKVSELLETRSKGVTMSEIELVARKGTLALLGFTEQEIDGLGDLSLYSLQDLKKISDEKRYKDLGLNGSSTQKIIPWSDVRQAITEGWELVSKLEGTNEAIVRLPK